MITLTEFLSKWNGEYCEVGGSANAKNQCVDLANAYITEVLGLSAIFWTNAQDFPSKIGDKYEYIVNTPTGIPDEGSLIIWKSADGFGHIAIALNGCTSSKIVSFDQNWPTGTPCHVQNHTYANVLGWLKPKVNTNMYRGYDLSNPDSMKIAIDTLIDVLSSKYILTSEHNQIITDLNSQQNEQAKQYAEEKKKLLENISILEKLHEEDRIWSDQARIYEGKLRAVLGKFAGVGISMSPENDSETLSTTISSYITDSETARSFVTKVLADSEQKTPEAVLEALQEVDSLKQQVESLKKDLKKDNFVSSFKIGSLIIKLYKNG